MDAKPPFKLIAMTLLVGSVVACAVETGHMPQGIEPSRLSMQDHGDPLAAEIARCHAVGADGANDSACKAAWAKNRERFFAPALGERREPSRAAPEKSLPKLPSEMFPDRRPSSLWPDANHIRSEDQ